MADLLVRERLLLDRLPRSEQDHLTDFLRRLLSPFEV
jgi:hypothetical protein